MAQAQELADKRSTFYLIDPRKIREKPGLNVRDLSTPDNIAHVQWLAADIAQHGVRTPLEVFLEDETFYVSSGHCRLAATMLAIEQGADVKLVKCMLEERGRNDFDRLVDMQTMNAGKPLTALEQGVQVKRMLAMGKTIAEIATALTKSVSWVNGILELQEAPPEAQAMILDKSVSPTLVQEVLRAEGNVAGTKVLREAVKTAKAAGKTKATKKDVDVASRLRSELADSRKNVVYAKRDPEKIEALIFTLCRLVNENRQITPYALEELLLESGIKVDRG